MKKYKQPNWHDTNMALFGSDLEKKIKAAAALDEPAWKKAGREVGMKIWRIEKFHVVKWSDRKKGRFHVGDSYIVLNTYKKFKDRNVLAWDIHFWIGSESTADEYGTAAYKTVELDHLLDDKAHQHRETQGNESELFRSYFKGSQRLRYLSGGIETGFRHVETDEEKKAHAQVHLYRIKGLRNHISLKQVPLKLSSLNDGDVYVLDAGGDVWQWNGINSNAYEKRQAGEFLRDLKKTRQGNAQTHIIDQKAPGAVSDDRAFWALLPGRGKIKSAERGGSDAREHEFIPQLWRLQEASFGRLKLVMVTEQKSIERARLITKDVFILDTGFHVHVWIGKKASHKEKRSGMRYGEYYLAKHAKGRSATLPITMVKEGTKRRDFEHYFNDHPLPSQCGC
eukprot:CAMPEP_0197517614 /NCGR_PEP_ID=MMETSP1318-20131121/2629_1 /TAXON_ID=552666 /ORGANISM="Partenskyella glossopodia, Strain RCC365" /LENGTH=394 /DNA_ID=CAMNT_0043067319 /DNA_START=66 /DNA_END=1247 /DNA_ORIENTATION=-